MKLSDLSLISLVILNNDHRAFGKLVEKYQSGVRSLLLRMSNGNKALADDLAQVTFIRSFKYLKNFRGSASFSTWIYRIAYNVFIDNRKTTRHTEDIEGYDYIQDNNQSTTTVMDIQNGLKTLKENEKICIMLHYDNGFSHPEIADILNMPVGTVKTNILRGKEKLKKYFDYEQQ